MAGGPAFCFSPGLTNGLIGSFNIGYSRLLQWCYGKLLSSASELRIGRPFCPEAGLTFRAENGDNTFSERQTINTKLRFFFDVLLTVHLSIILVIHQLNAQILVL